MADPGAAPPDRVARSINPAHRSTRRLPTAGTPDPATAPAIRWGILGPGWIARAFAAAVGERTASSVVAVGSRRADRAAAFATEFGIARSYGSYRELVADPDVDAVYVSSPHSAHREHALLALGAGKPVLVEKAFTRNAAEALEVVEAARARGLLLAEAMWSRYLPHYDVVRQVVAAGLIGEPVSIVADHSQKLFPDGPERLAAPELAGGALLDLGVYLVNFADLVMGPPARVTARGRRTDRGVDATTSILLESESGAAAALSATMLGAGPCSAVVVGTAGRLELDGPFYGPTVVRLYGAAGSLLDVRPSGPVGHVPGFAYQAAEFARSLRAGRLETPSMPTAVTVRVMGTLDEIRRQVGVRYPGE